MRKLFVILGFLLAVGFFGVEMARKIKITEGEEKQEAKTVIGKIAAKEDRPNKAIGSDSAQNSAKQAEEAEAKRSKPTTGEFRKVEKKFVDLTRCEEMEEFPLKPEFEKPVERTLGPGEYAITTEGSTDQWFIGGVIRGFWSDGGIMDLSDHKVWILENGPKLPVQDAPYGIATMKIGTKGAPTAIGLGKKFSLEKSKTVYWDVNMFQGEEFYKKSYWNMQGHLWQCDSQKETESTAKPIYMRVKAPNEVNVRTGPSAEYGVVKKIVNGDVVPVHRTENGWSNIGDGWVNSKFLYESEDN